MRVQLCPPGVDHLQWIADNMNPLEVAEVAASSGFTPMEALTDAVSRSYECYVARLNDVPQLAFGIACDGRYGGIGIPWMLATTDIQKWPLKFLRMCDPVVARWGRMHGILTNYVDCRNEPAIRWLQWLGFSMAERIEQHGVAGVPFFRFEKHTSV